MESRKDVGSSSLSLTSELFGSKDSTSSSSSSTSSSPSSSGIFGSIFAPPSKVLGRESVRSDVISGRRDSQNEAWNPKPGVPGDSNEGHEGGSQGMPERDVSSIYQEQRVQPCHLSSSIYYGGQDVYAHPQSTQGSEVNSVYTKDGGEDDLGSASRGNWWQGGLYY